MNTSPNFWRNFFAVFKREFFSYFNSPLAYIILIIFLLLAQGFTFFFGKFLENDNAALTEAFFTYHPWIYMVLAPAVGMRLWSEEHRLGTFELIMTMPVTPWQTILGKFVAASVVWFIALLCTFPIVVTVGYLGHPDFGPIVSAYLASYLYAICCLAITCAISAFTRSQVICLIISVAICLLLTLLGTQQVVDGMVKAFPGWTEGAIRFVAYLCLMTHFYDLSKGLVLFKDLLYFLSIIIVSLSVTAWALQVKRA